jgi:bacillithiol biosynthesis deacetylase BshB1
MCYILAIAVHPDDIELSCAGTLIKHAQAGQKVCILDLTRGELGTRGSVELRNKEAQAAAQVMGVAERLNADMADGFFSNDEAHQRKLISYIRYFKPQIVIANALEDRHPDHGRAGHLIAEACFLSGLRKITTHWEGEEQQAWRPKRVYHMIQDRFLTPSFAIDISETFQKKIEAILCYTSQFTNENKDEPTTYISSDGFMEFIKARDVFVGKMIGVRYAEGYVSKNLPGIDSLDDLLLPELP